MDAYLSQPAGPPQLGAGVQVRADQLGAQVRAQMLAASRSLNGTAMIVVSDYGKLSAIANRLPSAKWRLPDDTGPTLALISLAVRQSAAEKLVPLSFPWLLRGTPERSAQSMSCKVTEWFGVTFQRNVWANQPLNASLAASRDYFESDGRAVPAPYWFAMENHIEGKQDPTPSAALSNLLFNPVAEGGDSLGINLYSFLSPRVFGRIHQANDTATDCDLLPRAVPRGVSRGH